MALRASIRCWLALTVCVGLVACASTSTVPAAASPGQRSAPSLPAQTRAPNPPDLPRLAVREKAETSPPLLSPPQNRQTSSPDPDRQKAQYALALQQLQGGQTALAEQSLREITKAQTPLPGAYANLAILRLRANDGVEAEKLLLEAIKRNAQNSEYYNLLGLSLRYQGRFLPAKEAYEHALQIDGGNANAMLNLGILYDLYLVDLVNAKRYYQSYLKIRPDESQAVGVWLTDLEQRIGK